MFVSGMAYHITLTLFALHVTLFSVLYTRTEDGQLTETCGHHGEIK
jgi:hypothetical protein